MFRSYYVLSNPGTPSTPLASLLRPLGQRTTSTADGPQSHRSIEDPQFPPLSVNSKVTKDDLFDGQINDYEASGFKFTEGRKLCPTLENYEDLVLVS